MNYSILFNLESLHSEFSSPLLIMLFVSFLNQLSMKRTTDGSCLLWEKELMLKKCGSYPTWSGLCCCFHSEVCPTDCLWNT